MIDVNILFPEINSFGYKPSTTKNSRSKRRRHRKKEKLGDLKRRADEEAKQPSDVSLPVRQEADEEVVKQPSDAPLDVDEEDVKQPSDAPPPPSVGQDADEEDVKQTSGILQTNRTKDVSNIITGDGKFHDSGGFLEVNLPEKKRNRLVSLSDQMERCSYHLRSHRIC